MFSFLLIGLLVLPVTQMGAQTTTKTSSYTYKKAPTEMTTSPANVTTIPTLGTRANKTFSPAIVNTSQNRCGLEETANQQRKDTFWYPYNLSVHAIINFTYVNVEVDQLTVYGVNNTAFLNVTNITTEDMYNCTVPGNMLIHNVKPWGEGNEGIKICVDTGDPIGHGLQETHYDLLTWQFAGFNLTTTTNVTSPLPTYPHTNTTVNITFNANQSVNWTAFNETLNVSTISTAFNMSKRSISFNMTFYGWYAFAVNISINAIAHYVIKFPALSIRVSPVENVTVNDTIHFDVNVTIGSFPLKDLWANITLPSGTTKNYMAGNVTQYNFTTTPRENGTLTWRVRATDGENYTTIIEESLTVEIQSTPPDTEDPTLTILSPENGTTTNNTTVTVKWEGNDNRGIDHYTVRLDDGAWIRTNRSSHEFQVTKGNHTVAVKAFDGAGNTVTKIIHFTVKPSTPSEGGWSMLKTVLLIIAIAAAGCVIILIVRRFYNPPDQAG